MAIAINGINGGISGKVGNVVFYQRNGVGYVRTRAVRRKKEKASKALAFTRNKFKMMQQYIIRMLPVVRIGFQFGPGKGSAYNRALSYNLKNAVKQENESLAIDWPNLSLSQDLPNPVINASFMLNIKKKKLDIHWQLDPALAAKYSSMHMHACVMLVPVDLSTHNMQGILCGNTMNTQTQQVKLLTYAHKITHHAYLSFFSIDVPSRSTDSKYIGELVI